MPGSHLYRIYGLTLASEVRLSPEHEALKGDHRPDITLTIGSAEFFDAVAPEGARDPYDGVRHIVLPDGRVYLRNEDVFEAVVSADGRAAACQKVGEVDHRSFEAYLVNFVVSTSLTLQGEEPLHSTVIEMNGHGVGLLGSSGAGKSTLAAFLISKGADLVTDDMLRVEFQDDRPMAYPGPYRLKLLDEPGRRLLPDAVADGYFNPVSGKMMVQPRGKAPQRRGPVRLAALFRLGGTLDGSVALSRLSGVDLAQAILSSAMDDHYALPARLHRQMQFAARLAGAVPVYALSYPRAFDVLGQVADRIQQTFERR